MKIVEALRKEAKGASWRLVGRNFLGAAVLTGIVAFGVATGYPFEAGILVVPILAVLGIGVNSVAIAAAWVIVEVVGFAAFTAASFGIAKVVHGKGNLLSHAYLFSLGWLAVAIAGPLVVVPGIGLIVLVALATAGLAYLVVAVRTVHRTTNLFSVIAVAVPILAVSLLMQGQTGFSSKLGYGFEYAGWQLAAVESQENGEVVALNSTDGTLLIFAEIGNETVDLGGCTTEELEKAFAARPELAGVLGASTVSQRQFGSLEACDLEFGSGRVIAGNCGKLAMLVLQSGGDSQKLLESFRCQ